MAIRKRTVILSILATLVGATGVMAWRLWPLYVFLSGAPVLYRLADVPVLHSAAPAVAIVGATLVDGNGGPPIDNAVVVIRAGRIVAAGPAADVPIPPDAVRIDAAGETVLPGLIDMHVHVSKGDDLQLFLAAGVTTVRDVGNFTDTVTALAAGTDTGETLGPRIFFSGESFVHESGFAEWQRPTRDAAEATVEVRKRIAAGASVIKIVADITPDLVEAIVTEAHRAHVPVTADILGNNLVTAERAVELGVDGLEHVSGVPQSIHADGAPSQSTEAVNVNALFGWLYADAAKEAALINLMVDRGTYVVPTFVVMPYFFPEAVPTASDPAEVYVSSRMRGFWTAIDRLPSFSPAMDRASEAGFLMHFAGARRFVGKLEAAGGRIVAGTDTPTPGVVPGFSLHRELEFLVQAGLSPMRAIQAATKTAAEVLGKADELGTIEAGKLADLIIVRGQPHVRIRESREVATVVKNGVAIETAGLLALPVR